MANTYLNERKTADGFIRLYAVTNSWNSATKKQIKEQVYIGCKRPDGTYNFNEKTQEYLYLLRGTEYERAYYQWQDCRTYQRASETTKVDAEVLRYARCTDLCGGIELLLSHVSETLGLDQVLEEVFGQCLTDEILTLAYYCASHSRSPLYAASVWSEGQKLRTEGPLNEGDISRILRDISASKVLEFLSLWLRRTPSKNRLSLDITSVSSYAKNNPDVMLGYNRDKEALPQINLLLMVDQITKLPVWFEELPGAISDMTTVKDTIQLLTQIDNSPRIIVCDRGFGSMANIKALQQNRFKFTVGLPLHNFGNVRDLIEEAKANHEFSVPNITLDLFEENDAFRTQCVTKLVKWNDHRVYLHLYYCPSYKYTNENELMQRLDQGEKALKKGKKNEAFRSKFDQRIAKECFIVKETPKRGLQVKCLPEKVDELKEECGGYFAIASNQFKNGSEALYVYKLRDGVEKRFDDIKNEEDCRRLRVHSSERMRARLFIQFIAEILRCYLLERKQTRETDWKNLKLVPKTVNDIMRAMASLRYIHIEGHRPFYKRPTKTQLGLLKFYDIPTTSKTTWPSLN